MTVSARVRRRFDWRACAIGASVAVFFVSLSQLLAGVHGWLPATVGSGVSSLGLVVLRELG